MTKGRFVNQKLGKRSSRRQQLSREKARVEAQKVRPPKNRKKHSGPALPSPEERR
ncbi:MAG: hypothetical protein AB1898_03210 [Acidobacteriota bacterium]